MNSKVRMARNFEDRNMHYRWKCKVFVRGQVSNIHYRLKFGDAFVAQHFKYQICVTWKCGEVGEGATLLWAKISSSKYALSVKVRRSYCGPKLQVSNVRYRLKFGDTFVALTLRYRCIARKMPFWWIWVKPDSLIEEIFYLTWGERLVQSRQWGGIEHITRLNGPEEASSWLENGSAILTATAG